MFLADENVISTKFNILNLIRSIKLMEKLGVGRYNIKDNLKSKCTQTREWRSQETD